MSALTRLCPGCGTLVGRQGRCATCKRDDERQRYATSPQRQLRSSRRYQRQRAAAKARDGYRCVNCEATDNLETHHVVALEDGGDPFALDNLITLCADCHRRQRTFLGRAAHTPTPAVSQSVRVWRAGGEDDARPAA